MQEKHKKPLIVLTGPTAVGKTALSIGLAKAVGGEIISADSMQVYKGMDIGTAKIMPEEMQGVKHYLVNELEPDEEFNVVVFQRLCKQYMEQIRIAKEVLHSRRHSDDIKNLVKGLMIESYIEPGSQKIGEHCYGKSITDPCLGWDDTERLLYDIAELS